MQELGFATELAIFIVSLVIGVALHEAMHAWVGYALGDDTAKRHGRTTLNPLAHIDPILTVALPLAMFALFQVFIGAAKPVPFNPRNLRWGEYGMAVVALAGPFTNLLLAVAGSLAFSFFIEDPFWAQASVIFVSVNVAFFVFNMLPIPPLDGSRALYVIAPDGLRNFMNFIESRLGILLVLVLFVVFHEHISPLFGWVFDFVIDLWV